MRFRFLNFALLSAAVLSLVMLSGCQTAPKVYSNQDAKVDFSSFKTYAFFPELATDRAGYESLDSSFLKVAVAQQLDDRGLVYDAENPDLLVNFYITSQEKIRSRSVPTTGGYYGFRDPFYEPWGGYVGYETQITQYTEGTLQIDVIDAGSKKLVWEGATAGRVTDKDLENLEGLIDEAVKQVFTKFPVTTPGS